MEKYLDFFQVVSGLGVIVLLGHGAYLLSTQSNQKKLSFKEWVQKSDVSLTYFENNDKSDGRIINGENWWEFKSYVIDLKGTNCLEEIRKLGVLNPRESVRRFPNCRIGTLDYLISEYKKYNPGGSIPYGINGELTISEGGKETEGRTPTNIPSLTHSETQIKESESPNIVKVLNRVRCHEGSSGYCAQSNIDLIWRACLENGFTTSMPTSNVASSRELIELVATTLMETRTKPVEQVDENGIVSNSSENVQYQIPVNVKGYCLGSEYIVSKN